MRLRNFRGLIWRLRIVDEIVGSGEINVFGFEKISAARYLHCEHITVCRIYSIQKTSSCAKEITVLRIRERQLGRHFLRFIIHKSHNYFK